MKSIKKFFAKIAIKKFIKYLNNYIMKKSWKTTAAGWLALVGAMSAAGFALMDGDPSTKPDAQAIFDALTALGIGIPLWIMGIFARDKNVSSEQQGVTK